MHLQLEERREVDVDWQGMKKHTEGDVARGHQKCTGEIAITTITASSSPPPAPTHAQVCTPGLPEKCGQKASTDNM